MNMQKFLDLLNFLRTLPTAGKILSLIAIVIISAIAMFFFSSCGTTQAIVRTSADSASTTISISTNNPTDVGITPNVSLQLIPKNN